MSDLASALTVLTAGSSTGAFVVVVVVVLWRQFNHTRCVSRCCGRRFDASVDVGRSPYAVAVEMGAALPPSPPSRYATGPAGTVVSANAAPEAAVVDPP
jgi:hypothetical protein